PAPVPKLLDLLVDECRGRFHRTPPTLAPILTRRRGLQAAPEEVREPQSTLEADALLPEMKESFAPDSSPSGVNLGTSASTDPARRGLGPSPGPESWVSVANKDVSEANTFARESRAFRQTVPKMTETFDDLARQSRTRRDATHTISVLSSLGDGT